MMPTEQAGMRERAEHASGLWLRIYVRESLRSGEQPLYAALVALARREGLAGATVFRGMEGFGGHRHLHTTRLVDVSDDLPMIVDIVDGEAAIRRFIALLDGVVPHGLVAVSPVRMRVYAPTPP
jgi:PII-like signaling protein